MKTGVGPPREQVDLPAWERDAFIMITEVNTYPPERTQVSHALKAVGRSQSVSVQDAFQRNARKMWRPS